MSDRDVTVVPDDYTAKLMAELTRVLDERDTLRAKFEVSQSMRHAEHERYIEENAKLQKQGARLFDKTLDLADENHKLRELVTDMWTDVSNKTYCPRYWEYVDRLRELGIEVDA